MQPGLAIGCGCFGSSTQLIGYTSLLRTALLLAAALLGLTLFFLSHARRGERT